MDAKLVHRASLIKIEVFPKTFEFAFFTFWASILSVEIRIEVVCEGEIHSVDLKHDDAFGRLMRYMHQQSRIEISRNRDLI